MPGDKHSSVCTPRGLELHLSMHLKLVFLPKLEQDHAISVNA